MGGQLVLLLGLLYSASGPKDGSLKYWAWLAKHGVRNEGLALASFGGMGRGVRTARHFRAGEELLRIAARASITSAVARAELARALGGGMTAAADMRRMNLTRCEAVTLFLMREKQLLLLGGGGVGRRGEEDEVAGASGASGPAGLVSSEWAPFVAELPERPSIPLFYGAAGRTAAQQRALAILRRAPTLRARLREQFALFEGRRAALARRTWRCAMLAPRLLPGLLQEEEVAEQQQSAAEVGEGAAEALYRWASAIIASRSWATGVPGECELKPLVDLLNHDSRDGALLVTERAAGAMQAVGKERQLEEPRDGVVRAARAFAPGEQLFVSYFARHEGKCNSELLWLYGMVEDDAAFDCAHVTLSLPPAEAEVSGEATCSGGTEGVGGGCEGGVHAALRELGLLGAGGRPGRLEARVRAEGGVPADVLSFLRVAVASPGELGAVRRAAVAARAELWRQQQHEHQPEQQRRRQQRQLGVISAANERRALLMLRGALARFAAEGGGAAQLQADIARLGTFTHNVAAGDGGGAEGWSFEEFSALRARVGEARALQRGLAHLDELWHGCELSVGTGSFLCDQQKSGCAA